MPSQARNERKPRVWDLRIDTDMTIRCILALMALAPGRPESGVGHYLRDIVYGALDGVVTTLAVVAGVAGADLGVAAALVLGIANLAADGLSMGASNYLGLRSELEQRGASVAREQPWRHGAATFGAFVVAGGVPLMAFLVPLPDAGRLSVALGAAAVTLWAIGAARRRFLPHRRAAALGFEMAGLGLVAAAVAYGVGAAAATVVS